MKRTSILIVALLFAFLCVACSDSIEDANRIPINDPVNNTSEPVHIPTPEPSPEPPDEPKPLFDMPPLPNNPPDYGIFKNYIVSPEPVTITNDAFIMEIPANTPYHIEIEQKIMECINWVQAASGFSFHIEGTRFNNVRIDFSEYGAYGGEFGIVVNAMDYIFDVPAVEGVYLHELSHTLQSRLVNINHHPFQEAFAILNSAKVARDNGLDFLYWHLMKNNYSYIGSSDEAGILSDFEHWYRTNEGTWDTYLYGFRFAVFLEEKYGDDILPELITNYSLKMGVHTSTKSEFVDFLVEQTDKSVFTDFVEWYQNNLELFDSTPFPLVKDKEVIIMPIIHDTFQSFTGSENYELDNVVLFDFFDSHAYANFKGLNIFGISGLLTINHSATIYSYDLHGTLLEVRAFDPGFHELSLPDASTLIISGFKSDFWFKPLFERCYTK